MFKSLLQLVLILSIIPISMGNSFQKMVSSDTDDQIIINIDLSTRRPIIELTINGEGPYKFIFDTGSSTNVIDEKLNQEFGFTVVDVDTLGVQGTENKLVSRRVVVPKINFPGTNILKDTEMSVVNLRGMLPIDGIISGIFFDDYLVAIDYPRSELILIRGELNKENENVTPIIENPNVLSYNLEVSGNIIESHLDTGSPGGFSIPYSMKDKLIFKEAPKEGQEIRTPVASFKSWNAELIGNIKIGNIVYTNPSVKLVEKFEYANLGYAVIKDLRTTIDRKNNLIKFEKSSVIKELGKEDNLKKGKTNDFTGWYGDKVRQVIIENGEMYLERAGNRLKLVFIAKDMYKMVFSVPTDNELPNIMFNRDDSGLVNGLTFQYKDGRKDFVKKKLEIF